MKKKLNLTESAEYLGIHRHTIRGMIEKGELTPRTSKRGSKYFYLSDLTEKEETLAAIIKNIDKKLVKILSYIEKENELK